MEYSNEAIELLEGVIGDTIKQQKNKASFTHNLNKLNRIGSKYEFMDPEEAAKQKNFSRDLGKMQNAANKAIKSEIELRKLNPNDTSWQDNKADEIRNKSIDRIFKQHLKQQMKNKKN